MPTTFEFCFEYQKFIHYSSQVNIRYHNHNHSNHIKVSKANLERKKKVFSVYPKKLTKKTCFVIGFVSLVNMLKKTPIWSDHRLQYTAVINKYNNGSSEQALQRPVTSRAWVSEAQSPLSLAYHSCDLHHYYNTGGILRLGNQLFFS